jgi:diketogulonate reductase-like aldo/keto reductase
MKQSEQKSDLLSPSAVEKMHQRYIVLTQALAKLPWVCQGSVMHTPPSAYRWTRKINKKTVTVSLSREQAELISTAIASHRKLENILKQMRELSETTLLGSVPGTKKRNRKNRPKTALS